MADFFSQMKTTQLKDESNMGYTENGDLTYLSTGNALIDFSYNVSSYGKKDADKEQILKDFYKVYAENPRDAIKYLFKIRDFRGSDGDGRRQLFKTIISDLAVKEPEIVEPLLKYIPEYGRWDDLIDMLSVKNNLIHEEVVRIVSKQIDEDLKSIVDEQPCSLLGKWLPSINIPSKKHRTMDDGRIKPLSEKQQLKHDFAVMLTKELGITSKQYRAMTSILREHIGVFERSLATKADRDTILAQMEQMPSGARLKYTKWLEEHYPVEMSEYYAAVNSGEKKMNTQILEPHEIVAKYTQSHNYLSYNEGLETMWAQLPDKTSDKNQILVIRDGSGSMMTPISTKSRESILDVATALSVYFSEKTTGAFKDKIINFSDNADLVDMSKCTSLADKINLLNEYDSCSTNISAVMQLILDTAVNNHLSQDEMPDNLLIISDMEFNDFNRLDGRHGSWYSKEEHGWQQTTFDAFKELYEDAGYKLPGMIFWNLNTQVEKPSPVPMVENDRGLVLLSGFDSNKFNMICNADFSLTMNQILGEILDSDRYKPIEDAVAPVFKKRELINSHSSKKDIVTLSEEMADYEKTIIKTESERASQGFNEIMKRYKRDDQSRS